jgi:hypothetical protein
VKIGDFNIVGSVTCKTFRKKDLNKPGYYCHGLGYFGILLAMSWPRIFWD